MGSEQRVMLRVGLPAGVALEFVNHARLWWHYCGVHLALQIPGNSDPGHGLASAWRDQLVGSHATVDVKIVDVVDRCPTQIVHEFGVAMMWCSTS